MQLGFFSLLTLLFVAAKLFNVIDWSWWLVFSPMIISIIVAILIASLAVWAEWDKNNRR